MLLPIVTSIMVAFGAAASPPSGAKEVRVSTAEALEAALSAAAPGTTILVGAGSYRGFRASSVRGAAERPIVVRAEDPAAPPLFGGGLHLSDIAHVVLERLTITGAPSNGINIDDGGTFETPSHHVVLRDVVVRACGGRGNDDGIKLSGVDDFVVESCTVERWGRGGSAVDMVGCRRGLIDRCTFHDDEHNPASNGVQAKGGSRDVTIRRCRFEHAGQRAVNIGGSTGLAYFRPRPEGFEAKDIVVEGCTFIGSQAPIAFVGADGAVVRFNTFHRPGKWVVRILQETREPGFAPCRGGVFADNLVVYRRGDVATAVNVGPGTAPETFRFERNFWFAIDDPQRSAPTLPVTERDGAGGADPLFVDAANGDLRLREGSPARSHGAQALPPSAAP